MIEKVLEFEEGYKADPYYCSERYPTIGIGKKIGPKNASLSMYKFTCSREVAYVWLSEELKYIRNSLIKHAWYVNLNSDRQDIIKSMSYQLGMSGLLKIKNMIAAFKNGHDIHSATAAKVFDIELADVTRDQRSSAKAVNFGIIYGQSAFGLAQNLGISRKEAKQIIDSYFEQYPTIKDYMDVMVKNARDNGYVETILGRRRTVHGVRDTADMGDARQRSLPERIAINTIIQGSAADLIKLAMIRVRNRLREERFQAQMLLQIHDELVFETPSEELEPPITLVRETMTGVYSLNVALKVDVKTGNNWADCEPWN